MTKLVPLQTHLAKNFDNFWPNWHDRRCLWATRV